MKNVPRKIFGMCLMLAAGSACVGIVHAAEGKGAFQAGDWVAVSNEKLKDLRGGFNAGQGLTVSFGFVRTVTINGELLNKSSFNIPDIAKLTPEQAKTANTAISHAGFVVQNGPGNRIESSGNPDIQLKLPTSTIIQNSLNNQKIQTLTLINTEVNSLSLLKAINTQTVLKDAILGALGVH
jgi:hypothetical protein